MSKFKSGLRITVFSCLGFYTLQLADGVGILMCISAAVSMARMWTSRLYQSLSKKMDGMGHAEHCPRCQQDS